MRTKTVTRTLFFSAAAAALVLLAGAADPAAADDAKDLWAKNCAMCHGADGKGGTKAGKKLDCQDLTDPAVRAKFDKARMIAGTRDGVKNDAGKEVMKGYGDKLSEDQIKALIDYIHSAFGG